MRRPCLLIIALITLAPSALSAAEITVRDAAALVSAIGDAAPGDVITLAAGTYDVDANISCRAAGTAAQRITVRAEALGDAVIRFNAVEGFKVLAPYWTFENLEIRGACADDSRCEHAFHVVGAADFTTIRGNKIEGFNAHIKGNGEGDPRVFPDDVLIAHNELYSDAPRQTGNPVTPIDVVGGRRWRVEHNHIHDFEKAQGNRISYAAFLKGNSRDGVFAYNLIECERLHAGGVRLGLSFGGGGTGPDSICEDQTCTPEHQGGLMYNNIIASCPADVGVYVNKGQDVKIFNNTLINTTGIDVRFAASSAQVMNNLLDGAIRARDNATITKTTNIERGALSAWFVDGGALNLALNDGSAIIDQGTPTPLILDDFCLTPRDATHDIGAIEYTGGDLCDTTTPLRAASEPGGEVDMGGGEADLGAPGDDMGAASGDMGTASEDMGMSGGAADMAGGDMSAPTSTSGSTGGCGCQTSRAPTPPLPLLLMALLTLAGWHGSWRPRRMITP